VRFATGTKRVVVGEDAVYIWVDPKRADPLNNPGPEEVLWRVDKKTRGLTVVPDASQVIPETALVKVEEKTSPQISGAYSFTVKGSALGDDHLCLYRIPLAGGPPEMVFAFPPSGRGTSWFIVVGDDFYGTDNDGSLWHASALPGGAPPALIEQRGAYDDDDYSPLLGADRDVVYWQAGADPDLYTADGAPMMLFRKCRTSP
jgi:hypothetical protein